MRIHVVQPGETLWLISRIYGVDLQRIIELNRLQDIPYLIPGQALIIPTQIAATYTVQPGDTLWSISRMFNVSVESIVRLNRIPDPDLIYPGMVLRIPEEAGRFGLIEVNGFIEPSNPERETEIINEVGEYLTYISPFSYQINEDGGLTPLRDDTILEVSRRYNIAPMMVITNFRAGNFDSQLVHNILIEDSLQEVLIDNILDVMETKEYSGLNIDFERIPAEDRELYNSFLQKAVDALHPNNYFVSTALAPKPYDIRVGPWHGAHDYQAHGEIVDFVIIMTYEWGWSGGPPMAVSPINQVRGVVEYAVSVIPPQKIMIGMPLYGYDWPLPYTPGGQWATRINPQQALILAARYGANIDYDETAQAPFFNYFDEQNIEHVVWFEDARSVQAKLMLVSEFNLKGVSYWVLGLAFPQNWVVLNNMFDIVKVVR